MLASPTATRHSRDSKRGTNLEKSFRQVIKSGDRQQESKGNIRQVNENIRQVVRTKR